MSEFTYVVTVQCESKEQSHRVMTERIRQDEDLEDEHRRLLAVPNV